MDDKEKIDLLKWLIQRSDSVRSSYSNRAALVLSANALILAAIVFLQEKIISQSSGFLRGIMTVLVLLSLGFMTASLIFAITASASMKGSRKSTGIVGDKRIFLSAAETFDFLEDYKTFKEAFLSFTPENFIDSACGELCVILKLQQQRYNRLNRSIQFILISFLSLVTALTFALLFVRNISKS